MTAFLILAAVVCWLATIFSWWSKNLRWAWFFAIFGSGLTVLIPLSQAYNETTPLHPPHVKVEISGGHGSGFHIGEGMFLTAAHVVGDMETVTLLNEEGDSFNGDVLWADKENDIAMIDGGVNAAFEYQSVDIRCKNFADGTPITLYGNPLHLDFIETRGYIANEDVLDATILFGMSGGAVMVDGRLAGMTNSVLGAPVPNGLGLHSVAGLGLMKPVEDICLVMEARS